MLTPQSNTSLEEITATLERFRSFAICGHVSPDGDCLGSQLALAHALRKQGKDVVCLLAQPDSVPPNLRFLPGIDFLVAAANYDGTPECFVGVDVPTLDRLGDGAAVRERCAFSITLDHHANETTYSDLNYVDPDSPSTSLLVWKLVKLIDAVNPESAQCALTGCITDTGRYSFQNTTPEAFRLSAEMMEAGGNPTLITREFFQNRRLASIQLEARALDRMVLTADGALCYSFVMQNDFEELDAVKADADPIIDALRGIEGVRVALMLRENGEGEVRGSLRAKDDTDVAQVARTFDGGGHVAAAGFTFHGPMTEALVQVPRVAKRLCFGMEA